MNSPVVRELIASINGREVGALREQADVWSFAYAQSWVDATDGFDLSPALKRSAGAIADGSTNRPVQWFFDNLLPEDHARDVLSRDAKIPSADAFGLLSYYGRESAGALTLMPPGEELPPADYLPLTDAELRRRVKERPKHSFVSNAPKRMSNAGAQDKLAVVMRASELFHPVGNAASTHLLKPDHANREEYPDSVANEYYVMRLAAELGIEVPAVHIRYVPDPIYLVERFDRVTKNGDTRRLHAIDACQLQGLSRTFKYTLSTVETLNRCINLCANSARSRQNLLEWALFNLLTGNSDAHLKNISFLVGADGIRIAPFYDLVSTQSYNTVPGHAGSWPNAELTTPIGAARTFAKVDSRSFEVFAGALGVAPTAYRRTLREFTERIEPAADRLFEEFEAMTIPEDIVRAGQLRVLRSVRSIIIKEMVAKLRPHPVRKKKKGG